MPCRRRPLSGDLRDRPAATARHALGRFAEIPSECNRKLPEIYPTGSASISR